MGPRVCGLTLQERFRRQELTAPLFNYLAPDQSAEKSLVSQIFASWNQMTHWLLELDALRLAT